MKFRLQRAVAAAFLATVVAVPARAQVTTFSADVNTAIDRGLAWLAAAPQCDGWGTCWTANYFSPGVAGDATGLVTLALLEKRSSADQNATGQGYSGASAADQATINGLVQYMIDDSGNGFYAYRNGQEMMALALYLRTGGPLAGAVAALKAAFDESINVIPGGANPATLPSWHGFWCYHDTNCEDASTAQFVVSGLAAARGVFSDPAFADAARLAQLNAVAARSAERYATGPGAQTCAPGGYPLSPGELGAGYSPYSCTTFQQTGSGTWIQLVGGSNLNSPGVQSYLAWLRNRYNYVDNNENDWGNMSYGYGLWSTSKALAFLDDGGLTPNVGNLSTADLGVLDNTDHAGNPGAYGRRQLHINPNTAPRPASFGPGGANYYNDPRELPRWYFDFAYTVISRQDGAGLFNSGSGWSQPSEQAYHILILQRSVGGGCLDADEDGVCDGDDNCPQAANADQADGDSDGLGDSCDACPTDASNDADGDGVCGAVDNCPADANASQANADGDGQGDACDACPNDANNDADADGVCGDVDNCAAAANSDQADSDGDGLGDACDACPTDASNDADGDGTCGAVDNCPAVANASQADADGDGVGDACDNCATTANADQADANGNGIGDACEAVGNMTGGGSVFTAGGDRVTHGMTLSCRVGVGTDNLQINWGKGNKFHLSGLTSASCTDSPAINSGNPSARFDTLTGTGKGSYNGVAGATISFVFTDAGEPGRNDTASIVIKNAAGATVLTVSGKLNNGNQQAH